MGQQPRGAQLRSDRQILGPNEERSVISHLVLRLYERPYVVICTVFGQCVLSGSNLLYSHTSSG